MNDDLNVILTMLERHFALVALILVGSLIVRHRAAAVQHRYWLLGFVWVALLPLLVLRGPVYTTGQIHVDDSHRFVLPATSSPQGTQPGVGRASETPVQPSAPAIGSVPTPTQTQTLIPTSPRWDPTMLWGIALRIYTLGVLFGFVRIAASLLGLRRLLVSQTPPREHQRTILVRLQPFALDPTESEATLAALRAAAEANGLKHAPRLIVNPSAPVPLTFWLGRHTIVIPSEDVSQAVLLHECAHIKRGDWFAQLIARMICAAFWFDPILVMIERKMRALSETAADDCVVSAGIEPTGYAEELYSIAASLKTRQLDGGLAIVGNGDLKARIGELLRPGPRITRVRFRWMAAAAVAGGAIAIACAALHYQSGSILAADHGLVVLPDGGWVRVIGISGTVNGRQEAWDLDGNLFPDRPTDQTVNGVMDWPNGTCLLFASSLPDTFGFEVTGVGAPGSKNPQPDSYVIFPRDQNGSTVWCAPIDLPPGPITGVTMRVPGSGAWKTVGTADYDRGRMTSTTVPGLFPPDISVHRDIVVPLPRTVKGTLELRLMDYPDKLSPREAIATTSDVALGEPLRIPYVDDTLFYDPSGAHPRTPVRHRALVLRARAASIPIYFGGIPTHPLSNRVMRAVPPEGVVYEDATDGRYRFSDGEEISLRSVSDWASKKQKIWAPFGGEAIDDPEVAQIWRSGGHPGDVGRMFHFSILGSPNSADRSFAVHGLSLFDAVGNPTGQGSNTVVTPRSTDTYRRVFVEPNAKPQDYVVRISDPTRATRRTVPIRQVYPDWTTKPSRTDWTKGEIRTIDFTATRIPALSQNLDTLRDDVTWTLVDRRGHRIVDSAFQTDGTHDTYTIPQSSDPTFTAVQIVTMPYIYVRFPNVWVNPR